MSFLSGSKLKEQCEAALLGNKKTATVPNKSDLWGWEDAKRAKLLFQRFIQPISLHLSPKSNQQNFLNFFALLSFDTPFFHCTKA